MEPGDQGPRSPSEQPTYDGLCLAIRWALERLAPALARAARGLVDSRAWRPFGFARIDDYTAERFGRSGRWLRELAKLGEGLERFPALGAALDGTDGKRPIGLVAAQQIARVASPASVKHWIGLARRVDVRKLKQLVREARRADADFAQMIPPADQDVVEQFRAETTDLDLPPDPGAGFGGQTALAEDLDDSDQPSLVRMDVPMPVRAAFDETYLVHRAVWGGETTVGNFIDCLMAEAWAAKEPIDPESVQPVDTERARAGRELELILYRDTDQWSQLRGQPAPHERGALRRLGELTDVMQVAGTGPPAELDDQMMKLLALQDRLERDLGRLLMHIGHERGFGKLAFGGLGHYAEQRLGLSRRNAEERAMVARRLLDLPLLREAYEDGRLSTQVTLCAVRALGRGPVPEQVERQWVEHAERTTVKRLREEGRVLQQWKLSELLAGPPRPPDDEAWYGSLRLAPGDIRERVSRFGAKASEPGCPGTRLTLRLRKALAVSFMGAVEAMRARLETEARSSSAARRQDGVDGVEACDAGDICDFDDDERSETPVALEVALTFSRRGDRVPAWVGLLALLEGFVRTWDDPEGAPDRAADKIYIRDGWRCTAPACTSRRNLHNHHLVFRSRGGDLKAESNQSTSCEFHHLRGIHGSYADCYGTAPLDIVWRLGHPNFARWYKNEQRIEVPFPFDVLSVEAGCV